MGLTSSNPLHLSLILVTWNSTNLAVPNGSTYCKDIAAMTEVTNPRHITSLSFENVSSSLNMQILCHNMCLNGTTDLRDRIIRLPEDFQRPRRRLPLLPPPKACASELQ